MRYLWTEDTGAGFHFWKLVNQLFFDNELVVESKGSNQGLLWMRAPGVCCNHSDAYRSGDQPQPDVHKTTSTV